MQRLDLFLWILLGWLAPGARAGSPVATKQKANDTAVTSREHGPRAQGHELLGFRREREGDPRVVGVPGQVPLVDSWTGGLAAEVAHHGLGKP